MAISPHGYVTTKDYVVILGTIPTVQSVQPAMHSVVLADRATILRATVLDAEGDAVECRFLLDGTALGDWNAACSQTWTPILNQIGKHVLTAAVRDSFGGEQSQEVSIRIARPYIEHP